MAVGNLRSDNSWLTNLTNSLGSTMSHTSKPNSGLAGVIGTQPTAAGSFPPAPNSGSFLNQLMGNLPQNQFSANPLLNANTRLGG